MIVPYAQRKVPLPRVSRFALHYASAAGPALFAHGFFHCCHFTSVESVPIQDKPGEYISILSSHKAGKPFRLPKTTLSNCLDTYNRHTEDPANVLTFKDFTCFKGLVAGVRNDSPEAIAFAFCKDQISASPASSLLPLAALPSDMNVADTTTSPRAYRSKTFILHYTCDQAHHVITDIFCEAIGMHVCKVHTCASPFATNTFLSYVVLSKRTLTNALFNAVDGYNAWYTHLPCELISHYPDIPAGLIAPNHKHAFNTLKRFLVKQPPVAAHHFIHKQ